MRSFGLKPPPTVKTVVKHAVFGKPSSRRKSTHSPKTNIADTQPVKAVVKPRKKVFSSCSTWLWVGLGFVILISAIGSNSRNTTTRVVQETSTVRPSATPLVMSTRIAATSVPSPTVKFATDIAITPVTPIAMISEDDQVASEWLGVTGVTSVSAALQLEGGFYGEVRVRQGFVNAQIAEELRRIAAPRGSSFSVILDDGTQAVDFVWDNTSKRFLETALETNPSIPRSTELFELPYTVLAFANVRGCTSTDCALIVSLTGGTVVTVTGQESGADVGGSTLWYAVRLQDGRAGYVHSSLVGAGVIVVSTPAPAVVGGGSGGNSSSPAIGPTAFVCPSNCDGAVAMGLTAQQAATCPGLDRDKDGVACYGE
jgi:hypothetical protein